MAHGAFEAMYGLLQHLHRIAAHKALIVKLLGELDHGAGVHSRLLHWKAEAEAHRSCLAPTACNLSAFHYMSFYTGQTTHVPSMHEISTFLSERKPHIGT